MLEITEIEVKKRLAFDNPWWERGGGVDPQYRDLAPRAHFETFFTLVSDRKLRRAIALMGPRRVGKTVMIHQAIAQLLKHRTAPRKILYVSLDTPTYFGLPLEQIVRLFHEINGETKAEGQCIFFDEVQYLKDWEVHLKSLVDSYPNTRFVASGSAAAALRLKSRESGAGRFTDFLLPPLTFTEFLDFRGQKAHAIPNPSDISSLNMPTLNSEFLDYLNFGGFPEAVVSAPVRRNFQQHVGADIIDKVLLKDLPSLYGIQDTQELNRLFAVLAYNTGNEISIGDLASRAGVAKNTLLRYLEYLEASFLIRRIHRIDENARHFKRTMHFKVYLTNPCIRSALFGPIGAEDDAMGRIAETAFISQLGHGEKVYYARWDKGEVDFVFLNEATQSPKEAVEIKWSDRIKSHRDEIEVLLSFLRRHKSIERAVFCTRSHVHEEVYQGRWIWHRPVALWCHIVGYYANVTEAMAATSRAFAEK